jgi:hypothetical protein
MKPERDREMNREPKACYGTMFHDTLHFMAKLTLEAGVAAGCRHAELPMSRQLRLMEEQTDRIRH